MKILVVDDNKINRMLLKYILQKNNKVDEATDGIYAVDLVVKNDYDIIFMDMMMPKMNGYEATKRIKTIKPQIPIYIVSAYKKCDFPDDWKNGEYEGILSKPVELNKVTEIINNHKI